MVFGLDDAAMIGLVGSAISGGTSLLGQGNQAAANNNALQAAIMNYQLQQQQMRQQYELATAGRTDARGNRTYYTPGLGWREDVTPTTKGLITASDAAERQNLTDQLTRVPGERTAALNRRLNESATASPLLDAMRYGYGLPSKESVLGRNVIAGATGASENADNAKNGFTTAALRTGTGYVPLQQTLASADRGAVSGQRTAIANAKAGIDPLYESIKGQFMQNNGNTYNTLASRAANYNDVPFQPTNIDNQLDSGMNNAAYVGAATNGRNGPAVNGANDSLLKAMVNAGQTPSYGTAIGGLTENLKNIFKKPTINNVAPSYEQDTSYSQPIRW